jgi:hypothetical protein
MEQSNTSNQKQDAQERTCTLTFRNIGPSGDDDVKYSLEQELEREVELIDWEVKGQVNYRGPVISGSSLVMFPQSDIYVNAKYREL